VIFPATPLPLPKLPFWRTVGACYATVARNLEQLARMSWLWLVILLPVYASVQWLIWPWTNEIKQQTGGAIAEAMSVLPHIVEIPALASIAVAWHRLVLREEGVHSAAYLRIDRIVWSYALVLFAFLALAFGPMWYASARTTALPDDLDDLWAVWMPLSAILMSTAAALMIVMFFLPRLSLVLPAIALGERLSLADAWRVTRGNTWRLACAVVLCELSLLALLLPLISLYLYLYAYLSTRTLSVIVATISALAYVLVVTIGVTLLSLAYRHFVWRHEIDSETTA
jgi:hypothetical protein